MGNARKELVIAERQERVAALFRSGTKSQRKIAAAIGVSQPTVKRDLDALKAQWREDAHEDIAAELGLDLSRLDAMLAAIWPQVLRGDLKAMQMAMSIIRQRAAMFGYNAPVRVTGADGSSPVEVRHTHTHHDFSQFSSEEATALYELAARYDQEAGG